MVEKKNFIPAKSMFTSVKISFLFQSNHHKIYKSVTAFSFKNAEFPTLTPLSPRKPISDCINIPLYKSVHNSFFTPVHKPFYASPIKTVPQFVHKLPFIIPLLVPRKNFSMCL